MMEGLSHITIIMKDLEKSIERVRLLGLEVLHGRSRIEGEGKSFYFYDYYNHLFELHTGTLDRRLQAYKESKAV